MKKQFLIFSILVFCSTITLAQNSKKKINFEQHSIENTFDSVYNYSNKYQGFKVVKREWLQLLKGKVLDSLIAQKKSTNLLSNTIQTQAEKIVKLESNINTLDTDINTITSEKNSINFLGNNISKDQMITLFWSVFGILAILLALFIYKFKNSNVITSQAKLDLKELEQEYETHRKNALEREQKVMRKLQDELNKNR